MGAIYLFAEVYSSSDEYFSCLRVRKIKKKVILDNNCEVIATIDNEPASYQLQRLTNANYTAVD